MDKLKPCPFCGGRGEICRSTECAGHGDCYEVYYVECCCCKATTKEISGRTADGPEAQKLVASLLWNRRVEDG